MKAEEIRAISAKGYVGEFMLQEIAAQLAELNETLYNAVNSNIPIRVEVEPGKYPISVEQFKR